MPEARENREEKFFVMHDRLASKKGTTQRLKALFVNFKATKNSFEK